MKLTCSKSDLLNGVNIVSKAVPNKTTMSILECILIDASGNNIISINSISTCLFVDNQFIIAFYC